MRGRSGRGRVDELRGGWRVPTRRDRAAREGWSARPAHARRRRGRGGRVGSRRRSYWLTRRLSRSGRRAHRPRQDGADRALTGSSRTGCRRSSSAASRSSWATAARPAGGRRLSVSTCPATTVRADDGRGATGVDSSWLCVAADDGVMRRRASTGGAAPARRTRRGGLTKSDIGEPELAAEEASELVPGAPVVQVSVWRGAGSTSFGLRSHPLLPAAGAGRRRRPHTPARRSLVHAAGIGTVVTAPCGGTIGAATWCACCRAGSGVSDRYGHDEPVERAPGARVALNLVGVAGARWAGDVVVTATGLWRGYLLDVGACE